MSFLAFFLALWTTLAWALLLLALVLSKPGEKKTGKNGKESDKPGKRPGTEEDRKRIKEILNETELREELLKRSSLDKDAPINDETVDKILERIPERDLRMFHLAATQKELDLDLGKRQIRKESLYPTSDMEPAPMQGIEQMHEILPEQLVQDDDTFYDALSQNQLLIMQAHQSEEEKKTLMILIDFSGSMFSTDHRMKNGLVRFSWARAIAINLLLRAVKGDAAYLVRGFAGRPFALHSATTPEEAKLVLKWLFETSHSSGATDIWRALQQGCEDIRALKAPHEVADLLLISDGEESGASRSIKNLEAVKELLGDDIKLHVAIIGSRSPHLAAVATSYQEFR